MKASALLLAVVLMAAGSGLASENYQAWSEKHPQARASLYKIFYGKPKALAAFVEWDSGKPGLARELADFLIADRARTIVEFIKTKGADAATLKVCHGKYTELTASFRNWVLANPQQAQEFFAFPDSFKGLQ